MQDQILPQSWHICCPNSLPITTLSYSEHLQVCWWLRLRFPTWKICECNRIYTTGTTSQNRAQHVLTAWLWLDLQRNGWNPPCCVEMVAIFEYRHHIHSYMVSTTALWGLCESQHWSIHILVDCNAWLVPNTRVLVTGNKNQLWPPEAGRVRSRAIWHGFGMGRPSGRPWNDLWCRVWRQPLAAHFPRYPTIS